jgi:uncharacterized phage protein (TIGR01671 family)
MREIKFRAWDKKAKVMVMDIQRAYDGMNVGDYDSDMSASIYPTTFESFLDNENIKVMQFTGLKDKNGKEIYEGDIIEATYIHGAVQCEGEWIAALASKLVAKEFKERFTVKDIRDPIKTSFGIMRVPGKLEIIGNIYENPEMLK